MEKECRKDAPHYTVWFPELSYKKQEGVLYNQIVGKLKKYENSYNILSVFFVSSGMVAENQSKQQLS